ncbi:MAG: hypothetical protein ACREON_14760 [Gemmatimonadaceae bacterium]
MLQLPTPDLSPELLADWAELCCLFGDQPTLSAARISDFLQEEFGLDDFEDFAIGAGVADSELTEELEAELRAEGHDEAAEGLNPVNQQTEATLSQLSFRSQVVGHAYPITVEAAGARRAASWEERPIYAFLCLLGARLLYRLEVPFHVPARLFERVVTEALRQYVGGEALRFGWPPLEDEPAGNFRSKVVGLARRMGEDVGRMRSVSPGAKDYDLDVIAWRGFRDGKTPGQLVVVCQCAIGQDWREKLLSVDSWQEVITFNVRPVGALAFPVVPSREPEFLFNWHDVTARGNLPLDRLRLASLLDESKPEFRTR